VGNERTRKPGAYLGQVSISANGPVTLGVAAVGVPDDFPVREKKKNLAVLFHLFDGDRRIQWLEGGLAFF
jgi:hypothetical protein